MEDRTMQIRRILAPTDFSEPSKQAIAYAFELAQTFGATLVLLHVIEELPPYISSNATAMNPGITATHMTVLIVTIHRACRVTEVRDIDQRFQPKEHQVLVLG